MTVQGMKTKKISKMRMGDGDLDNDIPRRRLLIACVAFLDVFIVVYDIPKVWFLPLESLTCKFASKKVVV